MLPTHAVYRPASTIYCHAIRTYVTGYVHLSFLSLVSIATKNSNDHPLEGKDRIRSNDPSFFFFSSKSTNESVFFFYYTVFNFSNETHFVRKTSFVHRSGRGSFRFFETEFTEAGYRFEKNDHPVLHANYGKTEERRVHGPILRRNSTGSAERIFACTAFTVSPRCKSTVITMSLHHVTRIRSSNFCFCECASHVRARRLAWKAHESTHARLASSSSFETR